MSGRQSSWWSTHKHCGVIKSAPSFLGLKINFRENSVSAKMGLFPCEATADVKSDTKGTLS